MPLDKILIFFSILIASLIQIVGYYHYLDHQGIIYMATALYSLLLFLCAKYFFDNKPSQYSLLIVFIMLGIIGEYFDFQHLRISVFLKSALALAYAIVAILFLKKGLKHQTSFEFTDKFTFPLTSILLFFQAFAFVVAILPTSTIIGYEKLSLAIGRLSNTVNYGIVAILLTILYKQDYRIILLPIEIRIVTLIALISSLPLIENFFSVFLASF